MNQINSQHQNKKYFGNKCYIIINLITIYYIYIFKKKMWCEKDLQVKRKLRYYKEVINPTLEDQKYLSLLTSSKKKINIARSP